MVHRGFACLLALLVVLTIGRNASAQMDWTDQASSRAPAGSSVDSLWNRNELTAEAVAAISSPVGSIGAYVRYRFSGILAVEAGLGMGGSIHHDRLQSAVGLRLNLPLWRTSESYWAFSFGTGLSTGGYRPTSLASGPMDVEWDRANWLNVELGPEFRIQRFHARLAVGNGFLLNPATGRIKADISGNPYHGDIQDTSPILLLAVGVSL